MKKSRWISTLLVGSFAITPLAGLAGCDSLPGDKEGQGTVIGGLAGAAAGAAVAGDDDRLVGALIGGALGAGGGWLIGSQLEKADDKDDAIKASEQGRSDPAYERYSEAEIRKARDADLNRDGYVTLDEVAALDKAGLSDSDIIDRLEGTGQFFELTRDQERWLERQGVSERVVTEMRNINRDVRDKAYDRYRSADSGRDRN